MTSFVVMRSCPPAGVNLHALLGTTTNRRPGLREIKYGHAPRQVGNNLTESCLVANDDALFVWIFGQLPRNGFGTLSAGFVERLPRDLVDRRV